MEPRLTRTQLAIHTWVHAQDDPFAPVRVVDVADYLQVSRATAYEHLQAMVRKGVLCSVTLGPGEVRHRYQLPLSPLQRLHRTVAKVASKCAQRGDEQTAFELVQAMSDYERAATH